jgi:hypothetical protein
MVVNFKARGISWGARKLARTLTLNKIKKKDGVVTLQKNLGFSYLLVWVLGNLIYFFNILWIVESLFSSIILD